MKQILFDLHSANLATGSTTQLQNLNAVDSIMS